MGFSVSASFVLIMLGVFIAASAVYTTGWNTFEQMNDARDDRAEKLDTVHDTAINITSVTVDANCDVNVKANNTGTTTLALNETSLLLDNNYQTGWQDGATINGDAETSLWHPGDQLNVSRTGFETPPNGISLVTKTGVTDRLDTEDVPCA